MPVLAFLMLGNEGAARTRQSPCCCQFNSRRKPKYVKTKIIKRLNARCIKSFAKSNIYKSSTVKTDCCAYSCGLYIPTVAPGKTLATCYTGLYAELTQWLYKRMKIGKGFYKGCFYQYILHTYFLIAYIISVGPRPSLNLCQVNMFS